MNGPDLHPLAFLSKIVQPAHVAVPSAKAPGHVSGSCLDHELFLLVQGGILAIDFEEGKEDVIFTAGVDHSGKVYDRSAGRVLSDLKGHSKKVTGDSTCILSFSLCICSLISITDGCQR